MSFYPKHKTRNCKKLDGIWNFCFLPEDKNPEKLNLNLLKYDDYMAVPGAFDATPRYAGKRGTGIYQTCIETAPDTRALLKIEGLGFWARIFIDNIAVDTVRLPYSGVTIELPESKKTKRVLTIAVNNCFNEKLSPLFHQYYDFYGYGGIYRSIELQQLPECSIERIRVQTVDINTGLVKLVIKFTGKVAAVQELSIAFDEGIPETYLLEMKNMQAIIELNVPNFKIWSPETPNLHTVTVSIEDDDITERFGIRTVIAEKGNIVVNGERVKLLGFCRHEAHPELGPVQPLPLMISDLQHLKTMGMNFIRGVHYPMDQRFLDLCDQLGFLVWEESLGWNNNSEQYQNEDFYQLQLLQTEKMINNSMNHPSIILWGFLNEGNSEDTTTEMYKDLCRLVRKEDSTRLVTYASNHPFSDLYWKYVDVISVNSYPGWYVHDNEKYRPLDEISMMIEKIEKHLVDQGFTDKPFILSEIGAGAIYGWRDQLAVHWSEEYQADYLSEVCNKVINDDHISGLAIWHFADCRTYSSGRALFRPRAFNNKGIMDEYRRPKLAYHEVSKILNNMNSTQNNQ
jgi:beta-glucuronidase